MALRAGYYGVKRNLKDELRKLDGIIPDAASGTNPLATENEIKSIVAGNEITGVANVLKNNLSSGSSNGVTYTHNADDTVTLDTGEGSASAATSIYLNTNVPLVKGMTYVLDGGENTSNNIIVDLRGYDGDTDKKSVADVRDGGHKTFTPDFDGYDNIRARIWVRSGTAISNKKIYPMITPAGYYNGDYTLYAMTNQELTYSAADQKTAINAIITAATGAADFAAFKTAMEAITPVSRSFSVEGTTEPDSGSIPEEDLEPTTKKRTTKKTIVKEGE